MANKNKKEITIDDLAIMIANQFNHFHEEMTGEFKAVRKEMANEFGQVREEMANEFGQVREEMANGFNDVQSQINVLKLDQRELKAEVRGDLKSVKQELVWVKDVLEKDTTILKRLDEERIFTLSYVKRLENEIEKIKVHLKIA